MRDGDQSVLLEVVEQHIKAGNIDGVTTVLASEQYRVGYQKA